MKIDEHEQASKTMTNALGSLENRIREIYNLGYEAGFKAGTHFATDELIGQFEKYLRYH